MFEDILALLEETLKYECAIEPLVIERNAGDDNKSLSNLVGIDNLGIPSLCIRLGYVMENFAQLLVENSKNAKCLKHTLENRGKSGKAKPGILVSGNKRKVPDLYYMILIDEVGVARFLDEVKTNMNVDSQKKPASIA